MSFNKIARSRSSDVVQERLRENKQVWNKACSEFIARLNAFKPHLISFKRGLNGRGDAKAGLPISDIKNPFPSEIGSFLGGVGAEFNELASTFAKLVSDAGSIIQEQAEYASRRRQPQQVRPREQRAVYTDDTLIVEGSNALTRFWAHLSSFLSSDENKAKRLSMLNQAHNLFENFIKFEDKILNKGVKNIPEVLTSYFLVVNNFKALKGSLHNMMGNESKNKVIPLTNKNIDNESLQETVMELKSPSKLTSPNLDEWDYKEDMSYDIMKKNVIQMSNTGLKDKDIESFLNIYENYLKEKNENKLEIMQDRMHYLYRDLLNKAKKKFKKISNNELDLEITKFSSNYLSRLLKKYKHQFGMKDSSSAIRMEIYHFIRDAKKQIDDIMDLLEKRNLDSETLFSKVKDTEEFIHKMKEPINLLNILYQDKYYETDNNRRNIPNMDPAARYFTRQIRQDVDKPGW